MNKMGKGSIQIEYAWAKQAESFTKVVVALVEEQGEETGGGIFEEMEELGELVAEQGQGIFAPVEDGEGIARLAFSVQERKRSTAIVTRYAFDDVKALQTILKAYGIYAKVDLQKRRFVIETIAQGAQESLFRKGPQMTPKVRYRFSFAPGRRIRQVTSGKIRGVGKDRAEMEGVVQDATQRETETAFEARLQGWTVTW